MRGKHQVACRSREDGGGCCETPNPRYDELSARSTRIVQGYIRGLVINLRMEKNGNKGAGNKTAHGNWPL